MKAIDFGGKEGMCVSCHEELDPNEKRSGVPICIKCIKELRDVVKGGINMNDIDIGSAIEEFSDNVRNFSDFVSSSARLMRLDDVVVIQVCFNVYMDMTRGMADGNPTIARKIFKDAKRFIDIELERLEDSGEGEVEKGGDLGKMDIFEKMIGDISKMMKGCHGVQSGNDDVNSESNNANNRNFDHMPGRDNKDNGGNKDNDGDNTKKESEAGGERKRIRVD